MFNTEICCLTNSLTNLIIPVKSSLGIPMEFGHEVARVGPQPPHSELATIIRSHHIHIWVIYSLISRWRRDVGGQLSLLVLDYAKSNISLPSNLPKLWQNSRQTSSLNCAIVASHQFTQQTPYLLRSIQTVRDVTCYSYIVACRPAKEAYHKTNRPKD